MAMDEAALSEVEGYLSAWRLAGQPDVLEHIATVREYVLALPPSTALALCEALRAAWARERALERRAEAAEHDLAVLGRLAKVVSRGAVKDEEEQWQNVTALLDAAGPFATIPVSPIIKRERDRAERLAEALKVEDAFIVSLQLEVERYLIPGGGEAGKALNRLIWMLDNEAQRAMQAQASAALAAAPAQPQPEARDGGQ